MKKRTPLKGWKKALFSLIKLVFVLAVWGLIWFLAAEKVDLELVLPSPVAVFRRLWDLLQTLLFYRVFATSVFHVLCGFAAGAAAGFLLALFSYKISLVRTLFSPLMKAIRATPVASFILVVFFFMMENREAIPTVICFLMVLPIVWQSVLAGLSSIDPRLHEMAELYHIGGVKKLFRLEIPGAAVHTLSALRTSLGMAWKAGVAAEVLTLPQFSVGTEIFNAKATLETPDLYAWTLALILFSILLEWLLFEIGRKGERAV